MTEITVGASDEAKMWKSSGPQLLGWLAMVLLVVGFGSWSVYTSIAGAILASGKVEVEQSRQIVQHPVGGVVGEILAREGEEVKAGDVVIRLDDTSVKSELAVVENQYYESIARRNRLEAERDDLTAVTFDQVLLDIGKTNPAVQSLTDGQARLFDARRDSLQRETEQLAERKIQIGSQIEGLEAQHKAMSRQLELIQTELSDQEKLLEKGLVQASRVLTLQRELARLEGVLGEIVASKAEAAGKIIEIDIGILQLKTTRREDAITQLRDLGYRELELSEKRILLLETMSRLDIRAPVSGQVYDLQVHAVRAVVRAAEPVMYIVPLDQPLIISSRIDPLNVDDVRIGQEVTLRFSAFESRNTPELFGRVTKLSADAFVDKATGIAFYRAEILPNPGEMDKLQGEELVPGMPVEAFIRTSERTPLSYLVKPLANYFNKAFRED